MTMPTSRIALRLLASGDAFGLPEELIGDLLEEIASGRSRWWVCQQLIGLYGSALIIRLRRHARLTPQAVALALSGLLLASVSIAPVSRVLEAWLGLYYLAGMLSLFADMASRTMGVAAATDAAVAEAPDGQSSTAT
jgi:hypothetical protein